MGDNDWKVIDIPGTCLLENRTRRAPHQSSAESLRKKERAHAEYRLCDQMTAYLVCLDARRSLRVAKEEDEGGTEDWENRLSFYRKGV
jgi:hypothetical protein